jgi:hypothetical protein
LPKSDELHLNCCSKQTLLLIRILLGEIAPGVLIGPDQGHKIESNLRMTVLVRLFATPLGHVLAAFSVAALPQSSRKRPAKSFVA